MDDSNLINAEGSWEAAEPANRPMNFFPVKIAATWNPLPENIVSAGTVSTFKNRLDKFWITNPPSTTSY
ncbi:hypothetical protein FHG87_016351 [Trinorchestia longiramus]|nr:hypothetical protein FHG87_016351 [Trinorchestia longiramus]